MLFQKPLKKQVNTSKVGKEEESVRKKSKEVDRDLNGNREKFLCNLDFKKRLRTNNFSQIPNEILFQR